MDKIVKGDRSNESSLQEVPVFAALVSFSRRVKQESQKQDALAG